jgi:hypothetical protein
VAESQAYAGFEQIELAGRQVLCVFTLLISNFYRSQHSYYADDLLQTQYDDLMVEIQNETYY